MANGADIGVANENGTTALKFAYNAQRVNLAFVLRAEGAK